MKHEECVFVGLLEFVMLVIFCGRSIVNTMAINAKYHSLVRLNYYYHYYYYNIVSNQRLCIGTEEEKKNCIRGTPYIMLFIVVPHLLTQHLYPTFTERCFFHRSFFDCLARFGLVWFFFFVFHFFLNVFLSYFNAGHSFAVLCFVK